MYKLILLLFTFNLSAQTENAKIIDVRNVSWGMTIEEVLHVEKITKTFLIDTTNYTEEINKVLVVPSLIINNTQTKLYYEFRNNRLLKVVYYFYNQDTTSLFKRVVALNRIYNNLVSNKNMTILYCWSYGNESYKRLSNKNACEYKKQQDIDNLELLAKDQLHIQEAVFSLNNQRSIASFIFNLKENKMISKIQFIPSKDVKKKIINNSF